ncbi:MAG: hypothetical protein ACOYM5_06225 [Caulobacter sp.]
MLTRGLLALLFVMLAPGFARCEPLYAFYPVDVVFLPTDGASAIARDAALPAGAGRMFADRFKTAFPQSTSQINEQSARRTFVASLQVSRLSFYEFRQDYQTQTIGLMAGSIRFTNIATGEVLYTYTRNYRINRVWTTPDPDMRRALATQLYVGMADDLIRRAATSIRPFEITARARQDFGDLLVLDQGAEAGLRRGDSLTAEDGSELRAVFSDARYAVATADLGKPRVGQTFSRLSNQTLAELAKPTAMVLIAGNSTGLSDAELEQQFADSLGAGSRFNIVAIDRNYAQLVDIVTRRTNLSQQAVRNREPPDYTIRLSAWAPPAYSLDTNQAGAVRQRSSARFYAEVVDRSGRVVAAQQSADTQEEVVRDGMYLSGDNQSTVAARNALIDLAAKLNGAIHFEEDDIPVSAIEGDTVVFADRMSLLRFGFTGEVLRKVPGAGGLPGEVLAPIWGARIVGPGAAARAALLLPTFQGAPRVKAGDILRVAQAAAAGGPQATAFQACGNAESLGSISLPGFETLAINRFAEGSRRAVYMTDAIDRAAAVQNASGSFRRATSPAPPASLLCVQPVQNIELQGETCSREGVCQMAINLRLTYRIRSGSEVVAKQGLAVTVTSSGYPVNATAEARAAVVQDSLAVQAPKLLAELLASKPFQQMLDAL